MADESKLVFLPLASALFVAGARGAFLRTADGRVFEVAYETALWREVTPELAAELGWFPPLHAVGNVPGNARWSLVRLGDGAGVEEAGA